MSAIGNRIKANLKTLGSHFGLLIIILILTLTVITISYLFVVDGEEDALLSQQHSLANEEVSLVDYVLRTSITNTFNDMQVVKNAGEFTEYVDNPNPVTLDGAEQLFYRIASSKEEFLSIRYMNRDGDELIRINRNDDSIEIIPSSELQNKSDTYYYQSAMTMNEGEFYISYLDLNVENGSLVTPYEPIIRFIVPVFDSSSSPDGFLVFNYNAYHILSIFIESTEQNNSFTDLGLFSNGYLFQYIYDNQTEEYILTISEYEITDTTEASFTDIHIDEVYEPLLTNDSGFLQIYSYLHTEQIIEENGSFLLRNQYIIYILDLVIFLVFVVFGVVLKIRNDDKVLLNANVYLSNTNKDGVLITDNKKKITYINHTFENVFDYSVDEVLGKSPEDIIAVRPDPRFSQVGVNDYMFDDLIWNHTKSGIYILSQLVMKAIPTFSGTIQHFIGIYSDPTSSVTSTYDTILNKDGSVIYRNRLKMLAQVFDGRPIIVNSTTLFVIRVREFINFANDHSSLFPFNIQIRLASYLKQQLGDQFEIAIPRSGYLMVMHDLDTTTNSIEEMIDEISHILNTFTINLSIHRSIKYLISVDQIHTDSDSYVSLIHNAFVAMETLKQSTIQKYLVYTPPLTPNLLRDDEISQQLENGFKNDEFYMNYQVQISLLDNRPIGVEALLRWHNEHLGNIPPNEFIPKIEKSYHISSLSKMVVQKVIQDIEPYHDILPEHFLISVNMTSYDFFNKPIMEDIVRIIEESPISTDHFCFEITESNYLNNTNETNEIIEFLHTKKIIIALDDFGKGFSALGSLKQIHVDKVKIDRVFIKDYPDNDDGLVFHMITELVNNLGLTILVEGTETQEQVDLAIRYGCQEHQGYLISKPVMIQEFIDHFLKQDK
ncbi:MAG: EAL domain-containing protein [Bacilli bacterium]|nr:EAL domain-containing protein [Bacilli bacterium]MBN2877754.1 EAL domain-containing protein [Bacilli bacterium]